MVEKPQVLLISGPAGAGKTETAREWARSRTHKCAHISLDDIRLMVKSGHADPRHGWGSEQRQQFRLARGSVALLARRFIGAGINCVIDDVVFPDWPEADYPGWSRELGGMVHRLVVLLPALDAVLKRNREREAYHRLPPEMMKMTYEMMVPWRDCAGVPVIDNSCLSVGQTVRAIEAAIGEGVA